jgi:hypothetical protein
LVFPPKRLIWPDAGQLGGIPKATESMRPNPILAKWCRRTDLLQRMLKRSGFATAGASGGREALGILNTESVDLVISDMVMPEMDGLELMRGIRTDGHQNSLSAEKPAPKSSATQCRAWPFGCFCARITRRQRPLMSSLMP